MTYSHFLMLAKRLESVQAERAYFVGLAVNAPQHLADIINRQMPHAEQEKTLDMADFLQTINGR